MIVRLFLPEIPLIGTNLDIEGKTYTILSTTTVQEILGQATTFATILEIDPETGADLGKETQTHTIQHIVR